MSSEISFNIDFEKNQLTIIHQYEGSKSELWNAYTHTELLEKWWAPEPYKAIVVSNNFKENGLLHYYMSSPEGEKHYCLAHFLAIDIFNSYEVLDAFCDENAVINTAIPRMRWKNTFVQIENTTTVTNIVSFENSEDMKTILEMGFEEGYKLGLKQLRKLLNQ
jgi:uncharacterized protein YndB with AHSA1/START domain